MNDLTSGPHLLAMLISSHSDMEQAKSEGKVAKWQGNNRKPTAKCRQTWEEHATMSDGTELINVSRKPTQTSLASQKLWPRAVYRSLQNWQTNVLNNHSVILGHLARWQMTGISTLKQNHRHLSRTVSIKYNKNTLYSQLHSAPSALLCHFISPNVLLAK